MGGGEEGLGVGVDFLDDGVLEEAVVADTDDINFGRIAEILQFMENIKCILFSALIFHLFGKDLKIVNYYHYLIANILFLWLGLLLLVGDIEHFIHFHLHLSSDGFFRFEFIIEVFS